MGKGLHLAVIRMKGSLDYRLSIAGGKGGSYIGILVHGTVQLTQLPDYRLQGRALIAAIRSIQKLLVPAYNSQLGSGGACIDAQIHRPLVSAQVSTGNPVPVVPRLKLLIISRLFKQHKICLPGLGSHDLLRPCHALIYLLHGDRTGFLRNRRPYCHKVVAVLYIHNMLRCQLQCLNEAFFQLRQKMQRAAQKCHIAINRPSLCQIANGLIHHRLKNRQGNISLFRTVIHQCLNIRLGKNAAAGSYSINLPALLRQSIQARRIS